MKTKIVIAVFIAISFCSAGFAEVKLTNPSAGKDDSRLKNKIPHIKRPEYAEGEVLVKFKPRVSKTQMSALNSKVGVETLKEMPKINVHRIKSTKGMSTEELLELYHEDPDVEYVEPNYIVRIAANPNDPDYPLLWGLNNLSQTGGTFDADIDAPQAWDFMVNGWVNTVVAVIDTGVDYNHPDLAANMWVNTGEVPGDGIDNDGNGYIDDYRGWDFYNKDNDPIDDHYHGTHVAGTIAAAGYNGIGIIGVNYKAKIMPLKFLGSAGRGYTSDAVEAILYASAMGAKVMSNSWGGGDYSTTLRDAINTAYANGNGALFIAAAGNDNTDNDFTPLYPSSYDVPNVVAVAATDHNDAKASFSNYGFTTVDIGAPGEEIYSTLPSGRYGHLSGTSMAVPHVSGVAALILSAYSYLTVDEAKNLILNSAEPIATLRNNTVTGGRLNAYNALSINNNRLKVYISSPVPPSVFYKAPTLIKATVSCAANPVMNADILVSFSNGEPTIRLYDDGIHNDGVMNDGIYANDWTTSTFGPCDLTVSANKGGFTDGKRTINLNVIERIDYGYNALEPYNWIDATTGTALSLGNDAYAEIPIGFDFKFYKITYSSVKVTSNGYLTFGRYLPDMNNDPIPLPYQTNNIIAPFWDDLNPAKGGNVYYQVTGTAPSRALTIEWYQVPHSPNIGAATFEVTLYESSNDIVFQYQDVFFEDSNYNEGRSATIGIEGPDGFNGTQYSYNTVSAYNNLAIRLFALKSAVSGKILLQGRTNHSDLVTFELRNPGEISPVTTYNINTAADGSYILTEVHPGTYDITAKGSNFLRTKQNNVLVISGQSAPNIDFSLRGGDANNDNSVATADMGILRAAWLTSEGQPKYDSRADFNGDKSIGTADMGIMRSNWLKSGAQ